MKVSRASFLKVCAVALVGAGAQAQSLLDDVVLQAAAGGALPAATGAFDWSRASAALFRPHVTTKFSVSQGDAAPTTLVLDRIVERPCRHDVEQFSLIFRGPAAGAIDGIHTLRHATLGAFDLFIAPVGAAVGRRRYEACFSRRVSRS